MKTIKIIIADDQLQTREGLRTIIDLEEDMEVVGLARNGLEACELAEALCPDLVMLDIRMSNMNGIAALKRLKISCPNTKKMMLTTFIESDYIVEAIASGASGYMLKDIEGDMLITAIRDITIGQFILPALVSEQLAVWVQWIKSGNVLEQWNDRLSGYKLTEGEEAAALHLLQGHNNSEIANLLNVSEGTIHHYISRIYSTLEVDNRVQAVMRLKELL